MRRGEIGQSEQKNLLGRRGGIRVQAQNGRLDVYELNWSILVK